MEKQEILLAAAQAEEEGTRTENPENYDRWLGHGLDEEAANFTATVVDRVQIEVPLAVQEVDLLSLRKTNGAACERPAGDGTAGPRQAEYNSCRLGKAGTVDEIGRAHV